MDIRICNQQNTLIKIATDIPHLDNAIINRI